MASRPKLVEIEKMFEKGKEFTLSREMYIKLTGCDIPQDKNYTKNRSAIANRAKSYGFRIDVVPEQLVFKKY